MLLKIASRVPFIQCLVYFSFDAHKAALKKFAFLWVLSSLPVIAAAVLSPIPVGELNILDKLFLKLGESISVSEQFVYTANFITPILYIILERIQALPSRGPETFSQRLKIVFDGYGLVSFASLVTIILTAIAFGALKANSKFFESSFLSLFLSTYSPYIYLFALYCWYLSLLDGLPSSGDFVQQSRNAEKELSSGFSARIKLKG